MFVFSFFFGLFKGSHSYVSQGVCIPFVRLVPIISFCFLFFFLFFSIYLFFILFWIILYIFWRYEDILHDALNWRMSFISSHSFVWFLAAIVVKLDNVLVQESHKILLPYSLFLFSLFVSFFLFFWKKEKIKIRKCFLRNIDQGWEYIREAWIVNLSWRLQMSWVGNQSKKIQLILEVGPKWYY